MPKFAITGYDLKTFWRICALVPWPTEQWYI